ncbi:hypothetical protein BANRA_02478 [Klebsiella pneumoniae]|nr:hypothetical protein BANRA_02478 [Klebsiella pneumoniae]
MQMTYEPFSADRWFLRIRKDVKDFASRNNHAAFETC